MKIQKTFVMTAGAHLDTAPGAPASGTAPFAEDRHKCRGGGRRFTCHATSLWAVSRCALTAVLLLPLITGRSQEAGAPNQYAPIPAAAPPLEQPLSPEASFFHDQLAPYGQWLWIDPYGWVWSPSHVDAGWRPYTDGHWVYADCGWTWVSDLE